MGLFSNKTEKTLRTENKQLQRQRDNLHRDYKALEAKLHSAMLGELPNLYRYGVVRCGENHLVKLTSQLRAHDPNLRIETGAEGWWIVTTTPIEEAKANAIKAKVNAYLQLDAT